MTHLQQHTHTKVAILNRQCIVIMPDGNYLAEVTNVDDTHVDIKLDGHAFVLRVHVGLALRRFKSSYPMLPEFYAC